MKHTALVLCTILLIAVFVSATPAAQVGSQAFFYGEEPWGGSYLGVDTQDITSERLGPLHLKEEKGVEVTMVDQDAPAGKAGIKEHDVILTINDQQVESVEQLRRLIREIPSGRTITIGISRDGQPMTLHAQLAERDKMPGMDFHFNPQINVPVVRIPPINIPEIDVPNILVVHAPRSSGIMIENLTPQLGEYFGVKSGNGVLVRSVEKGSRGEQAGIKAGDVIVKINGSPVNDCSDFSRLLRSRNEAKSSVTVMRDRKEQVLTLALPQRHSGALQGEDCADLMGEAACAEIMSRSDQMAALMPGMTADIKRIQPQMEKLKKQVRQEMERQRPQMEKLKKQVQEEMSQGEWKKEMDKMQQDMEQRKEEFKQEMIEWQKKAAEI